jgi:hypothetical protein
MPHITPRPEDRWTPLSYITAATFAAIMAGLASPALAQDDRQTDVTVGYLNVNGSMHGTTIQVSRQLTARWTVVGEFDASHGPDPGEDDSTYTDFAALIGMRQQWRWGARFTPFWQLLGGGLFSNGEGRTCSCGQAVSVTYLAVQPGVGITAMMTPRLGIRAQADVQIAASTDAYLQGTSIFPRTTVGAVIRLGRIR